MPQPNKGRQKVGRIVDKGKLWCQMFCRGRKQSQPPLKPPKLGHGTLDIHLTSHHSLGVCGELGSKSLVGSPPSSIWVLLSSSLYPVQGREGDVRCGVQSAARETRFYRSEMKPDKRQG